MQRPDYHPHEGFIAPARKHPSVWLLIVGLCIAAAVFIALSQLFYDFIYSLAGDQRDALRDELLAGETPRAVLIQLFTFGLVTLSVALVTRFIQRRAIRSLLGPIRASIAQFSAVTFLLLLLLVVVLILPPWGMGAPLVPNMAPVLWVLLLPLSLLAVLVQTSAEEILFRGYIQQQLAARFASPLIWMVLPSALFALLHYAPAATGENAMLIVIWAGIFGMFAADLTARSGTLGPAIALHFVNNLSAILIVSLPDSLSGLALFHTPFSLTDSDILRAWLPVDFAMMFVFWLTARLALRR